MLATSIYGDIRVYQAISLAVFYTPVTVKNAVKLNTKYSSIFVGNSINGSILVGGIQ